MGIRRWFRSQMLGAEEEGDDIPPSSSLLNSVLGRDGERVRSLGEYDSKSYPGDLADLIRRREEVTAEVLRIDVTDHKERVAAIPQLQQLLRKYPHPLVYELLIHAYMDAGRFDEAKGVAFAARERRQECARSPHPEIRAETERLREWSTSDIDDLQAEMAKAPSAQ